MAWRLERLVQAGELDSTQFGWTIGWLELADQSERLQLKLAGNCHPDLAVERIGTRAFELSEEQWCEQHRQNQQEMNYFMTQLGDALGSGGLDDDR